LERQLGDERFVSRAPESVVSRQRDRLEAARRRLDALREAAGGHA
jgi:valyl-tRNA synthetase